MWGLSLLHGGPQMWGADHVENGGTGCERIHLRKKRRQKFVEYTWKAGQQGTEGVCKEAVGEASLGESEEV